MLARHLACFLSLAFLAGGCSEWDDPLYHASRRVENRWQIGARPMVVVDLKRGTHINVVKGVPGEVTASLRISTVSKISQSIADQRVLNSPGASFFQQGDTIRVIESPSNLAEVALDLIVPLDCDLELRGPYAEICVGCELTGYPGAPIPVVRLKAVTESISNARVESSSSSAPILDLEGCEIHLTVGGSTVPVTEKINGGRFGTIYRYKRP